MLQDQRLKIAPQLPEVPMLIDELLNFRMKPAPVSADPLAPWSEVPQADLLFAIAIAAWWIERGRKRLWVRCRPTVNGRASWVSRFHSPCREF